MVPVKSDAGLAIRTRPGLFDERGRVVPQGDMSATTIDLSAASAEIIDVGPDSFSYRHQGCATGGASLAKLASHDSAELIDYWIPISGSMSLTQGGRSVLAVADEFATATRRDPYDLSIAGPARLVLIAIPYRKLNLDPCSTDALAAWHSSGGDTGVTALLTQIATFTEFLADLNPGTSVRYGYHLVEMVTILTQDLFTHCKTYQKQVRAQSLHRMQTWAKGRLADPNLSIAAIAQRHNVSVRYVQKLYKEHGESPNRWIRNERLAGCLNDLRDPRNAELTIAMIARRWGFYNGSYFTRVFRERYGFTPAACRPEEPVSGIVLGR